MYIVIDLVEDRDVDLFDIQPVEMGVAEKKMTRYLCLL